jgi:hypothetical protein
MRKKKFSRPLTFSLDPKDFDQIKQISDQEEESLAEWVRRAVAAALENKSTKGGTDE